MLRTLGVVIPFLFLSPTIHADIYKCPGEKREVKYQNFPCDIDSIGSSATDSTKGKAAVHDGFGPINLRDVKALTELREWRLKNRRDHPTGRLNFEQ